MLRSACRPHVSRPTGRSHTIQSIVPEQANLRGNENVSIPSSTDSKQYLPTITVYDKIERASLHGEHTWSLINKHRGSPKHITLLYYVATTLESHTQNLLSLVQLQNIQQTTQKSNFNPVPAHLPELATTLQCFYNQPELQINKKHRSTSIYTQINSTVTPKEVNQETNSRNYHLLQLYPESEETMQEETIEEHKETNITTQDMEEETTEYVNSGTQRKKPKLTRKWETDPTITQLSTTFLENLQVEQEKLIKAGEDAEDTPQYNEPTDEAEISQQQRLRISLRKARNSDSHPTLKLFKSFTQALRTSDPALTILPINMSKQNLPALNNSTKLSSLDNNKLYTYFKTYYPTQKTSLSGYMHILTNLSFEELSISSPIYEWLETNRYTMRECPSHEEEMIQIGALCFSSEYIYREDLKQAIEADAAWKFPQFEKPPALQLTRGEFRSSKKSKKMIFIHTEKSKQDEVAAIMAQIYDGTTKPYPNGNMMLFIPLQSNIQYDASYRQKVIYNHEQFIGEEMALAIHGLQDPDFGVTLKNGQVITIRMLLRSIPATQGMNRPQLFQLAETNASKDTIIVTHQKVDKEKVHARLFTLENDIRAQLKEGEANNIFVSETDGIWFTPITKTKTGQIVNTQPTTKSNLEHIQHTHSILSSPPKKRPHVTDQTRSTSYSTAAQRTTTSINNPPIVSQSTRPLQNRVQQQQPIQTNSQQQQQQNPNLSNKLVEDIERRFGWVEEELQDHRTWQAEQNEWNNQMAAKIQGLESTTTATDSKVDMVLSKLDSWDIPTKRRGVTSPQQDERNAPIPHPMTYSGVIPS